MGGCEGSIIGDSEEGANSGVVAGSVGGAAAAGGASPESIAFMSSLLGSIPGIVGAGGSLSRPGMAAAGVSAEMFSGVGSSSKGSGSDLGVGNPSVMSSDA